MKLWALRTVSNMSPTIHDSKSRFLIISSKVGRPFRFGASYPETEVLTYSISLGSWSLSLSGNLICGFDAAIRKAGNIVHWPARLRRFPPPLTGMKTCLFCIDSNRVARDWNVDHTHLT